MSNTLWGVRSHQGSTWKSSVDGHFRASPIIGYPAFHRALWAPIPSHSRQYRALQSHVRHMQNATPNAKGVDRPCPAESSPC
jgi:hypothetical protein